MKFKFEEINGKIKKTLRHNGYLYVSDKLLIIEKNNLDTWLKFKEEDGNLFFDKVFFILNNSFPTENQVIQEGG